MASGRSRNGSSGGGCAWFLWSAALLLLGAGMAASVSYLSKDGSRGVVGGDTSGEGAAALVQVLRSLESELDELEGVMAGVEKTAVAPSSREAAPHMHPTASPQTAAAPLSGTLPAEEFAPSGESDVLGTLFTWGLNGPRSGRKGETTVPGIALESRQVRSVAGSAHTVVVMENGEVWSMGRNDSQGGGGYGSQSIHDSGQLGHSGGEWPQRAETPAGVRFSQVAAGRYHSVALSADGQVYTWGLNDVGQLGRQATTLPKGWDHCSSGYKCRSGVPFPVKGAIEGVRIVFISAGRYWTLAAAHDGRLFTWGMDGCATGVLPPKEELWRPRRVGGALAGQRVVAMDSGYVLWLARTDQGQVYSCDTQDDGYAGTLPNERLPNQAGELGRTASAVGQAALLPGLVPIPGDERAVSIAAGRQHGLAVTEGGRVYSWGHGGALLGRSGDRMRVSLVDSAFEGRPAKFVAAGEYFSLAATSEAVFGFGGNGYHMGGIGQATGEIARPRRTLGQLSDGSWEILSLQAGYQHVMAIARPKSEAPPPQFAPPHHRHDPAASAQRHAEAAAAAAAAAAVVVPPAVKHPTRPRPLIRHARRAPQPHSTALGPISPVAYLAQQSLPPSEQPAAVWAKWTPSARHDAIVATSPDIFRGLPAAFDPAYKNPCWQQNGKLRCVPYFQILGVSKCGTTDLYHRLAKHPELVESVNKGPHFWDECQWPPNGMCTVPPTGDWEGYVGLFDKAAAQIQTHRSAITGEASSNTFTASEVYLRGHDPKRNNPAGVTIAELIREAQPYTRLVVIFRDPVERYFSAFNYYRDRTKPAPTAADFHQRVTEEVRQWQSCVAGSGVRDCVRRFTPQQLIKGMYVEFLHDWLRHFPRHQLLFLRNEDYAAATRAHMEAVFTFLGMRDPAPAEWAQIMQMDRRNAQKKEAMLPETRRVLEEFYAPFNERLAQALGDVRFEWPKAA